VVKWRCRLTLLTSISSAILYLLSMKRVGILYHPLKEAAYPLAKKLEKFLSLKGVSTWVCSAWEGEAARAQVNGTDLILSIGGDGTLLRAAQAVVPEPTPITGINLGNLGFMTELSVDEAEEKLTALLSGEGWIDERSLLQAEISSAEEREPSRLFYALNDVVVARGAVARVIYVEASIDGEPLTTFKADGVIVATATGSTGYALAAGGPILHPQAKELLLLPIAPHLSSAYTLVLPSTAVVKLRLSTTQPATLSIDGHINLPLSGGTVVTVKHSSATVCFLRIHPETSFYSSLEQKLKGKQ
jgi:NAD+ kinase